MPNPALEFPLFGLLIGPIDEFFRDWRFPSGLSRTLEYLVLFVLIYFGTRLVLRYVLPWLSGRTELAVTCVESVCYVLLTPEDLVTRAYLRREEDPPTAAVRYGYAVLTVGAGLEWTARKRLPRLAVTRNWGGGWTIVIVACLVLLWNSTYCAGEPTCLSPFAEWRSQL